VVGGVSMKRFGFLGQKWKISEGSRHVSALFEGVEPDLTLETVMKGAQRCANSIRWIVAIGGGSPSTQPGYVGVLTSIGLTFEELCIPFNSRRCAPRPSSAPSVDLWHRDGSDGVSVLTDYRRASISPVRL
jgi:hypothetical protein